jgi:hypothetical protein
MAVGMISVFETVLDVPVLFIMFVDSDSFPMDDRDSASEAKDE